MKLRVLLWCSMAINAALALGILLRATANPSPAIAAPPAAAPLVARVDGKPASPPPAPGAARPSGPPFLWSQIASPDLKMYRDNLRAVGCPEPTVRDIMLAEIDFLFEPRRQSLLAGLQSQFWDLIVRREYPEHPRSRAAGWAQPLETLRSERQQMIDDILGKNYLAAENESELDRSLLKGRYDWLPAAKRDGLVAIQEENQRQLTEWAETVSRHADTIPTPEDNDRLQAIQQDLEAAERELLTPEEYAEFRLRTSGAASWAESLAGFEPTEAEWRTVAKLRAENDAAIEQLARQQLDEAERERQQQDLEAGLFRSAKEALGPERYAEMERAGNGMYQEIRNVTQRYGLAESVTRQAFETQRDVLARATAIRQESQLSADERASALRSIQEEAGRTMAQTLGAKAFATYMEYSGKWLGVLVQP